MVAGWTLNSLAASAAVFCPELTKCMISCCWCVLSFRLAGSLKLGRVPATGIMRTLQVEDRSTQLALASAESGRIEKTVHALNYIDDENRRRATLLQLNRGEGRHSLARDVFYGKRGESYVNATGKGRRISWVPLVWWSTSLCCGTRSTSTRCSRS